MNNDEIKLRLSELIKESNKITDEIKNLVYDYAKKEGLISSSLDKTEYFAYKKIIREKFGLMI